MEFEAIITAISSVGFPIVISLIMFYQLQKSNEQHQIEIDALKDSINQNTIVLTQLVENLRKEG